MFFKVTVADPSKIFPEKMSNANLPAVIPPLAKAYDVELVDFFDGWNYRYDILEQMDHHIADLMRQHEHGVRLTSAQYKMLQFGVYGNPVDAYKYFEYNYQSEWLAHR